ncbi:MAG: saccharopine dehydrogenase family protein [Candidatus Bathyarchaeota archaeon]|jgi:saccharopine dehydrogenase-like NADP-dependent oxidoreductase
MKVIVLGSGKIGSVIAQDFSETHPDAQLTLSDINKERAKQAAEGIPGASWTTVNTSEHDQLVEKMAEYDMALGALPGEFGYKALQGALEADVDMVDVSFTPENPLSLDKAAKERGVTLIPDCGVAPGLSNLLVGYSASRLEKVREAHIMVGGIPETPVPPLGYTITWSAEGLIDEYVRDVTIIEGGKPVRVPALSGLEEIDFPGVGKLEAFYTDGLRTLAETIPEAKSMWEKTLRYPGHVEKVRLLRELGFFDDETVTVRGDDVSPRLVTARLLERSLWKPEVGDLLAMNIKVRGEISGKPAGYGYRILDRFDHEKQVTAMARTTAYTASIVAGLLVKGVIEGPGVILPENLGMDQSVAEALLEELKRRGVRVEESLL